jgi:hypothetical protein
MNEENEEEKENTMKESLEGIGQIIAGELEIIGGILTADPITQAEGKFNVETGNLHLERSDELAGSENDDEESNQTE